MRTIGLPITQEWPPLDTERSMGVAKSVDGDWYVVLDDPMEIVAIAGAFTSEREAQDWIEDNYMLDSSNRPDARRQQHCRRTRLRGRETGRRSAVCRYLRTY